MEDRRTRLTKRLIAESLIELIKTKPVDQISVSELCRQADINRATFYRAVIAAAKVYGKPSGIITGNMKLIKHCESLGMQLFSCNSEVGLLAKQIKTMVSDFNTEV